MTAKAAPDPPTQSGQTGVGRQIACWMVALLGALTGLIYFHYQPDWGGLAGAAGSRRAEIFGHLPWMLGAVGLLALLALFWIINQQTRRRSDAHLHRARQAERALAGLREEIEIACGETPGTDAAAEHPIARWQAANDAQAAEIKRIAGEIASMTEALGRINESASEAAGQAQLGAETAHKGAAAAHNAIAGINDTRSRIQDAADRLKHLAQSTRQFNETVRLIRDVTAQTGVLSLNAALRGGGGGAGAAEVETAEEMQRLADRAARGAGEVAELARAIQSDADGVIASLEITAGKAAAGTAPADEAGRALADIENVGRELREIMERAASGAAAEAAHAQAVGEKIAQLRSAAEQSNANVSQIAAGLEKLQAAAANPGQSTPAAKPPER